MKSKLFCIAVVFALGISCNKDERQANKSLEGKWKVTAIETNFGDFSGGVILIDSSFSESGELGVFDFGEDQVGYEFTANNTVYEGGGVWELEAKKVNEGFVRVNQFTLNITDAFEFEVQFEDATKNAEKNAMSAIFAQDPETASGVQVVLWLERQ